ncbi:Alpha/Beta hydrolase fold [Elaphomyces granulatus]
MDASDIAEVDKFEVPIDTLGLHLLYEPKGATSGFAADVVAVHGLGGDGFNTWTDKASGKLWLKDFLPDSEYFRNSRIMTFGYDARPWLRPGGDPATTGRSFTFSESLLNAFRSKRILTHTQGRPIIFIGHSLGGIVIKNALVLAQARQSLYGDIYESAKSITFFGTPHQGANVAEWAGYLEKISKIVGVSRSNVLKELETWSPTLLNLSRTFSEQIPRLLINSFYEKQPYQGIYVSNQRVAPSFSDAQLLTAAKVVNEGSATLSYFSEIVVGLDANHTTICKFSSKESSVYREITQQLETRMYEIQITPER